MSDATDHVLDQLLAAFRSGAAEPAGLAGTLDMDTAYSMQVRLLHRLRGGGAKHTGWKIGQTSAAMRAERGEHQPAPGFLLADGAHDSGDTADLSLADEWFIEPELAFVVGSVIRGPGVDAQMVATAVASTHPAFELVKRVPGWNDRALLRAVNGTNAGYVLGPAQAGAPAAAALDALAVRVLCDGAEVASVRGGEVNDNPLESTAWLANYLANLGEALEPGQIVLTGSYTALLPLASGQSWRATIGEQAVTLDTA